MATGAVGIAGGARDLPTLLSLQEQLENLVRVADLNHCRLVLTALIALSHHVRSIEQVSDLIVVDLLERHSNGLLF